MAKIDRDTLEHALAALCEWEAVEVIPQLPDVLIPYVMNDAVECYIELKDCRIQGKWEEPFEGKVTFDLVEKGGKKCGLILNQGGKNVVSIWFQESNFYMNCYQYHQIGHKWRAIPGEEHLRRLVHLICVLHDKWRYLGAASCNEKEQKLYVLAEFAPFRYWSPINESILEWYPESEEGIEAFAQLCKEAKQEEIYKEIIRYKEAFKKDKVTARMIVKLAKKISESFIIYQLLDEKIREASKIWRERRYIPAEQTKINALRRSAALLFQMKGYSGEYPILKNETETIIFVEEQPFTVLEAEEYQFQLMELHIKEDKKTSLFGQNKIQIFLEKRSK